MQKRTDFFDNSLSRIVPDIPLVIRNKPLNNQLCADLSRLISAYPVISHFLRFAWQTTPDDVIALLSQINNRTHLTVELGLQTIHDKTAQIINRCYTYDEFLTGYRKLKNAGIRTCLHLIDGLPGETKADMLETAKEVARLHPDAVKIHLLHVNRNTALEQIYLSGNYSPLTRDEYIDIVISQLEYLPADIVIERITGDADKKYLVAPLWSADKIAVLGGIDRQMKLRDTYQGIKCDSGQL